MSQLEYKKCKKKSGGEDENNGWIMSYGDMMSLLLTFFIVIVSFSSIELVKFRKFLSSLQGSAGVLGEQDGSSIVQKANTRPDLANVDQDMLMQILEKIEGDKDSMVSEGAISFEMMTDGLRIKIASPILFGPGQSMLKMTANPILDRIALLIKMTEAYVRIEGYTDNTPIHTFQFPSNWELSAARAISVLKYFVYRCQINPYKIEAVGRGEINPIAPNDTPENRKKNRRVEIMLKWQFKTGKELLEERHQVN